jgi:trigger factor
MSVEIGSGRLIPGFEDQLVGAKANEQRTLNVTFPDDYPVDYLKGKRRDLRRHGQRGADAARGAGSTTSFAKSLGLEEHRPAARPARARSSRS